jgi:hypothetical protein
VAVKLEATGKLSCHGATAVLYHSMYANVATGPRSRLRQGFVCNSGQHLHASEHEDEETSLGQTVAAWTYQQQQRNTANPCCAEHNVQEVGEAPMHDPGPE